MDRWFALDTVVKFNFLVAFPIYKKSLFDDL